MTHKLEADGVQLSFDRRKILTDIYIKCQTGRITGLLGRNGSGKSCLMEIIYGTMPIEKSVRIDNVSLPAAFKRPDLVRYLPQFHFIPKSLSLKRVFGDYSLDFGAFSERLPGFEDKYRTSMADLSGGQRRLVELYVTLASKSQFIMLDEPFSYLSPVLIEKVTEMLIEEKANKGILITDHMYKHVLGCCDDLYVLSNGKTWLTRSPEEIETYGYAKL